MRRCEVEKMSLSDDRGSRNVRMSRIGEVGWGIMGGRNRKMEEK